MNTSPKRAWFDADTLWLELNDARILGVPLAWFPRLLDAEESERLRFELSPAGIHWDALDEDISVEGLLAGYGDMTRHPKSAA